jgi:hypothetical protein
MNEFELNQKISKLEAAIAVNGTVKDAIELSTLYILTNKFSSAVSMLEISLGLLKENHDINSNLVIVDEFLRCWRHIRYYDKETLRLNISQDRRGILDLALSATELAPESTDATFYEILCRKAFLLEHLGKIKQSLVVLSDLITAQSPYVDLSYVIFKAAIHLIHIGGNDIQAIDYLEFLIDDPPTGYEKLHVLAMLIIVYEISPAEYSVPMEQAYGEVKSIYSEQLRKDNHNDKQTLSTFMTSSEVWEMLAIQAVEKSEYLLATELLKKV